jgi:hypothetical protein
MNDAGSGIHVICIDGEAMRQLPEEVRSAALLIMAYVDGLTDGQRMLRSNLQQTAAGNPVPSAGSVADTGSASTAGENLRADSNAQAEAMLVAETENPTSLSVPLSASICGPISAGSPIRGLVQTSTSSSSSREVTVVWGPGAYSTVRNVLP